MLLAVYMTWDLKYYFWVENLHAWYFLGQKICHVLFKVLQNMQAFWGINLEAIFLFVMRGSEKYRYSFDPETFSQL